MHINIYHQGSFANFLYQRRLLATTINHSEDEILKKGLKTLAKMTQEEFEGLKLILEVLLNQKSATETEETI
ncbi:hypothetical protein A3A48_00470 [Candidatus Curtissbacteria bacterium RIFCSPLOWO2_01_FULL_37_9]|uniref:Uncharacterized protein n=1 Tax=Candidatus Curtissbacteria bacterium RIFCSPLOWO2_01_FULL_37_9 TaxID=1797724 RepID=A0A1F5GVK9_9BACT|nr:MAG: hypothetical protein A3A48_00470 [Candidatus Curtissbacteria bacterium RIFCSPLOWO2_01_FULL_37_9]